MATVTVMADGDGICFKIPNFGIRVPVCRFFNSGIQKQIPNGISGIENGIGILL
jgi:hypothetical protein